MKQKVDMKVFIPADEDFTKLMSMVEPMFSAGKALGSFRDVSFSTDKVVDDEYKKGLIKHVLQKYPFAQIDEWFAIGEGVVAFSDGKEWFPASDLRNGFLKAGLKELV